MAGAGNAKQTDPKATKVTAPAAPAAPASAASCTKKEACDDKAAEAAAPAANCKAGAKK
jgi:hypothetical protein